MNDGRVNSTFVGKYFLAQASTALTSEEMSGVVTKVDLERNVLEVSTTVCGDLTTVKLMGSQLIDIYDKPYRCIQVNQIRQDMAFQKRILDCRRE